MIAKVDLDPMLPALLLLVLAAPAPGTSFYGVPPDPGASLPADGVYPRGRRLAFMGYSGDPARDKAAGFSAAGPFYTQEDAGLEEAFAAGLPAVVHVGAEDGLDAAAGAAAAAARVRTLAGKPVLWWAVRPEELRPWRGQEMAYLAAVSSAATAADPLRRPVYLYNPNDREPQWLERVAPYVDVLAKGGYVNHMGHKRDRAWIGRGVRELRAASAKAGRPGQLVLVMPELAADPEPSEDGEVESWARHDVYRGLVDGAKGVLIWSLFRRPEAARTWELWYRAYARCARELGAGGLGEVFLFGAPRRDLAVTPAAPGELAWAEYAYGRARWLFVVNSGNGPAALSLSGWPAGSAAEDAFTRERRELPASGPLALELPAYGVAGLRLSQRTAYLPPK